MSISTHARRLCRSIRVIRASWPLSGPRITITRSPSMTPSLISITCVSAFVVALIQATSSAVRGKHVSPADVSMRVNAGTRPRASRTCSWCARLHKHVTRKQLFQCAVPLARLSMHDLALGDKAVLNSPLRELRYQRRGPVLLATDHLNYKNTHCSNTISVRLRPSP